jgi:hypothetical protein
VATGLVARFTRRGRNEKNNHREGQDQHPILDQVANKVIQKYQTATCQQLWAEKAQKAPPTPAEAKAIQFLRSDPEMRALFLNKVAAPIANKMFECGMIP